MATKFVSQSNAQALMNAIGAKFDELASAYTFKGSVAFANLPATLTEGMGGYVYNITDDFTTDARFVEGAGKKYSAGTDVAIVDLSTYDAVTPVGSENPSTEGWFELVGGRYVLSADTTVDAGKTYYEYSAEFKLNIASSFVNVQGIEDRISQLANNMVAATFNTTSPAAYEEGDLVKKDDVLYRFIADHTAGDPWDPTEVEVVTIEQLIAEVSGGGNDLKVRFEKFEKAIADEFATTATYSEGDLVLYEDELYQFNTDHAAGAWDATEVDKVTLEAFILALNEAINDRVDTVVANIADAFSASVDYAEGDVVVKDDVLYKFNAAHTAGAWVGTDADPVTLETLINEAEPEALSTAEVQALIDLLD